MASLGTKAQNVALSVYAGLSSSGITRAKPVRAVFLYLYRTYKQIEMGPVRPLEAFVKPGDAVLDIGANIGMFTRLFAKWVGPVGRVIAVEPEDVNFATLTKDLRAARMESRVEAVAAFCADKPGELHLERNEAHPGDHKIAVDGTGPLVTATTVDDLVKRVRPRRVALIKIDVQGAELMVLKGATSVLQQDAPALFIEIEENGMRRLGATVEDIEVLTANAGYKMHRLRPSGPTPFSKAELQAALKAHPYVDVLFLKQG